MEHDMGDPAIIPDYKVDILVNCYDCTINRALKGTWQQCTDLAQYPKHNSVSRIEFEYEEDADLFISLYNKRDTTKITWYQEILQGKNKGRMFVYYFYIEP